MNGRKNITVTLGFALSLSLLASALTVLMVSRYYSRLQFDLLNSICWEILEEEPKTEGIILAALKEYMPEGSGCETPPDILSSFGYRISDFTALSMKTGILFAMTGFLAGALLFCLTFLYRNKKESLRIQALTNYLEQINTGKALILSTSGEDDFSKLEDEIYKTVTFLYQTKDAAVQAKNHFSENLSNIAHQIKTPITAISLSVQMMKQDYGKDYPAQVERQLLRLTHLEEALLVLSRLDSGTLLLQQNETDVFTLLMLSADNLQELLKASNTSVDIPEAGEMAAAVDPEWTMEAIMNLMKNCMEHNRGGTIHCSYAQNPLYTEILIRDEGKGFAPEDLPHLFERFYRGQNADGEGIGIGLALSKEIIERQNGTIRARNLPDGGACFEIRFYIS